MKTVKQIKKYPLITIFFVFIAAFMILDALTPDKESSELENRTLAQSPAFSFGSLTENVWTKNYGEYIRDQFFMRDTWVELHGILQAAQGKLEAGGVWLARDNYQIAKNDTFSDIQNRLFPANIQFVAQLAQRHAGNVHAMIIPSPANILSDLLPVAPYQIDENSMMDDMFAEMQANGVATIDLRPSFTFAHNQGRQIYYRTDHHWTTDGGALIAYEEFCSALELSTSLPNSALRTEIPNFYGTNYSKTLWPFTVPDTLVYYNLDNSMDIYDLRINEDGTTYTADLMDEEKLSVYDKYAAFLHGNNFYSEIEGTGEGSVLVIKDSYGNSFVPYLLANYARIGVIDLRGGRTDTLDAIIEQGGYEDILVLYSFASFTEDSGVRFMGDDSQ